MEHNEDISTLLEKIDNMFKGKELTPYEITLVIKRFFEDISINENVNGGVSI